MNWCGRRRRSAAVNLRVSLPLILGLCLSVDRERISSHVHAIAPRFDPALPVIHTRRTRRLNRLRLQRILQIKAPLAVRNHERRDSLVPVDMVGRIPRRLAYELAIFDRMNLVPPFVGGVEDPVTLDE